MIAEVVFDPTDVAESTKVTKTFTVYDSDGSINDFTPERCSFADSRTIGNALFSNRGVLI